MDHVIINVLVLVGIFVIPLAVAEWCHWKAGREDRL